MITRQGRSAHLRASLSKKLTFFDRILFPYPCRHLPDTRLAMWTPPIPDKPDCTLRPLRCWSVNYDWGK